MQTIQKKDSMERFFEDVQAALARNYAHQQSEMVKRGMKSRILQGYLPAKALLGYEQTGIRGLYRPTAFAEEVGTILGDFADGSLTLPEARRGLQTLVMDRAGIAMNRYRVCKLLSSPYYAGYLSLNGKTYLGKHTPVISIEQHESIVKKLPRALRMQKFYTVQRNSVPEKSEGN